MNTHMRTVTTGPRVVQQTYGPPDDSRTDPPDSCIDRVPRSIRAGKKEAYTPKILSIGPFHWDIEGSEDMGELKERYVKNFFARTAMEEKDVLTIINNSKEKIQNFYSETLNLEDHKHVRMILLDAIFIVELLWRNFQRADDNLLRIPADKLALKLDLLLLENQLPYFLLKEIYDSTDSGPSFIEICLKFFRSLFFNSDVSGRNEFMHFTDMLRYTLVKYFQPEDSQEDNDSEPFPCATKLRESGVKFTRVRSRPLLEVKFEGGKLRMTRFSVKTYKKLKDYYNNKYYRNMAKLRRLYFGDVWKGTATIGASVLLILTFLQTINSFKQS